MLLQMAGGPELLGILLMFLVMGVVPLVVTAVTLYLLYQIRQDTKAMAASLDRIATDSQLNETAAAREDGGDRTPDSE